MYQTALMLADKRLTGHSIGLLRTELWGRALGAIFRGFDSQPDANTKPPKITSHAAAAVIYAQR